MAIGNVINNAFKYSSNQEVKLQIHVNDEEVQIKIIDKGVGIPDNEKQRIFDRFYRGKEIEAEGYKGYGLGLSLTELVISKMNGKIAIEDNTPTGTIFIVTLPIVKLD